MPPDSRQDRKQHWKSRVSRVLILLLVIAISLTVFALGGQIERLKALGYLGAFGVMLLGNATIILPAPGLTVVFALGAAFDPFAVGLAAGAGAALGELTGYLAGMSSREVIEKRALYRRFELWMKRYGLVSIFVLAVIPNPFFDIAGALAGALRYAWWRFLLVAWAGKTIQGILIAYAGCASANWVLEWLR